MQPVEPDLAAAARLRRLLLLLQLASPALPVGGFAYSQGLEKAIEDGLVADAESAGRWIGDLLSLVLARVEAPLWLRAFDACAAGDAAALAQWNDETLALRETAELRAKNRQSITMEFWRENVDRLLAFQDKKILQNAGSVTHETMEQKVSEIYAQFDQRRKTAEAEAAEAQDLEELKALEQQIKDKKE